MQEEQYQRVAIALSALYAMESEEKRLLGAMLPAMPRQLGEQNAKPVVVRRRNTP